MTTLSVTTWPHINLNVQQTDWLSRKPWSKWGTECESECVSICDMQKRRKQKLLKPCVCGFYTIVWKHECSWVRKGGFPESARTLFSTMVHSTSSSWITTSFFKIFTAYSSSVPLRSASITWKHEALHGIKHVSVAVPKTLVSSEIRNNPQERSEKSKWV